MDMIAVTRHCKIISNKTYQKKMTLFTQTYYCGAMVSNILPDNHQYFYNVAGWNVEEAYKAFAPTMSIENDTNFVDKCSEKIVLVGSDEYVYNLLFNNDNFKKISEEEFDTKYQGNKFVIIIVERNNK